MYQEKHFDLVRHASIVPVSGKLLIMNRFRHQLSFLSWVLFWLWRLSGNRFEAPFQLKNGSIVFLRSNPLNDIATATEVFAEELYDIPLAIKPASIRLIVDLGANVGYSCVYWLYKFPQAKIIAFEPHPVHVRQLRRHLEANSGGDRVLLIPKAAGTENGELYLTDDEASSELVNIPIEGAMKVDVVDWIKEIENYVIDLLKIDIEGSEYTLLADERFAQLNVRVCVLEWHSRETIADGRAWCEERLVHLGYQVCEGKGSSLMTGLLWAWKR